MQARDEIGLPVSIGHAEDGLEFVPGGLLRDAERVRGDPDGLTRRQISGEARLDRHQSHGLADELPMWLARALNLPHHKEGPGTHEGKARRAVDRERLLDLQYTPFGGQTLTRRAVADDLAHWIPSDGQVLEIGAGYCSWINAVRARRKVAVDSWQGFGEHAAPEVQPIVMDASSGLRSLGSGQFDAVLASNFLEHFDAAAASAIVADVAALLRPGGRFLVVQPNFRYAFRHYFDDYTHRSVFTDVSLANLLRAHGFTVDAVKPDKP